MNNYTILTFDEISSTSDLLKEHYSSFSNFTIIKANYQSEGRGQFDRKWISNQGENLLFSILLKDLNIKNLEFLKKWIIEGLFKLLKSYNMQPIFKEPNDIYINEDKICGILFETRTLNDLLEYVVIGIGLNINQTDFNGIKATSIKKINNYIVDKDEVFEKLLEILLSSYKT